MPLKSGENKKENHDAGEKKLSCQLPFSISYQFFNGHWYSSFISFPISPKTNKSSSSGPCRKEWKKVHEHSLFCISKPKSYTQEMILLFPVVLDTLLVHGFSVVRVCGKSPWPHTCPWSLCTQPSHAPSHIHIDTCEETELAAEGFSHSTLIRAF